MQDTQRIAVRPTCMGCTSARQSHEEPAPPTRLRRLRRGCCCAACCLRGRAARQPGAPSAGRFGSPGSACDSVGRCCCCCCSAGAAAAAAPGPRQPSTAFSRQLAVGARRRRSAVCPSPDQAPAARACAAARAAPAARWPGAGGAACGARGSRPLRGWRADVEQDVGPLGQHHALAHLRARSLSASAPRHCTLPSLTLWVRHGMKVQYQGHPEAVVLGELHRPA